MLFQWLVYPHFCRLTPAAGSTAPASWIGTAGGLVDLGSLLANGLCGSAVALMGRHEFDAALAVLVVVPINERHHPFAGLVLAGKGPAGVVGPVFDRSEQGFRVRVVIETLGWEKDLSTPISSSRGSSVAPRNSSRSLRLGHCRCRRAGPGLAAGTGGCQSRWGGGSAPCGRPAALDPLRSGPIRPRPHPRPPPCGSRRRSPDRGRATHLARWWAGR